jgi:Ca-activated chloride channel family protein
MSPLTLSFFLSTACSEGLLPGTWHLPLATSSLPLSTLNLRIANPLWLLALALIPLVLWLRGRRRVPVLIVPFAAAWHRKTFSATSRWPAILALTGLVLLIVALSRPQQVQDKREVRSQGYDLILAVDLSGSMLAEDYEKGGQALNRLQAIKPVVQAFINERANDRIGMVVFAGRAYTLAPLTFDHDWLARQTERLNIGMIEDGTAIGDGLGVALTRLDQAAHEENNRRKGAFIILLTDGSNNRGTLMPQQAAEIAKSRGIPTYTIGAGKDGWSRLPVMENGQKVGYTRIFSDLDEGLLHDIADTTGGHFYRADDLRTIESAFKAIDRAQKIEFQAKSFLITSELFHWPAIPGAFLLILGAAMKWTLVRTTNPQATKNFATA